MDLNKDIAEIMDPLFKMMEPLKDITQKNEFHPEPNVWNHSMQTMQLAFRESDDVDLIIAAMIHDVGKALNKIGHDRIILPVINPLVSAKTLWLVGNHMRIWYYLLGDMKKLSKVKEMANHPWLPELVALARWDKAGRNPYKKIYLTNERIVEKLIDKGKKHFKIPITFINNEY